MSPTKEILSYLLTGDAVQDARIREAFEQGVNYGRSSERQKLGSVEIAITQKIIAKLMRVKRWSLDETLACLEVPKKDRKMYQKIFASRQPKKQKQPKSD